MSAQLEVATVEEKRLDAEHKVHLGYGEMGDIFLFEYILASSLVLSLFRWRAAFAPHLMVFQLFSSND